MKNVALAVLACCCLLAVSVSATVVLPAGLTELAGDASVIARGQVIAVDGRWMDGRRGIETIVTLQAEAFLKGRLTDIIQFRVPGGTLGRYRNIVMGAPQFSVGQRVVVFLGASGPELPYILGLSQGLYRIDVNTPGEAVVSPAPVMPGVVGPIGRGTAARRPAPLAEFERQVANLVGGAR